MGPTCEFELIFDSPCHAQPKAGVNFVQAGAGLKYFGPRAHKMFK